MPLLLLRIQTHIIKAYRLLYTGILSTNTSVLFELDSKTHDTSSIYTSIQWPDTAKDPAIAVAHYDEACILGNKSSYLVHCSTGGDMLGVVSSVLSF